MKYILLASVILAGCGGKSAIIFTESTGLMDSTRDAHAVCGHLLIQAGKAGADIDPRALWDWCMVQTGAAI